MGALLGPLRKGEIFHPVEESEGTAYYLYLGDTENDGEMIAAVDLAFPPAYVATFGTNLKSWRSDYIALRTWLIAVNVGYEPNLVQGRTVWETDQTGGTEKIYQSYKTTSRVRAINSDSLIDFGGAINVTKDGVEGAERIGTEQKWIAKRRYVVADWESNYLEDLEGIRARTNEEEFTFSWLGQLHSYAVGEVLFLGFRATEASNTRLEVEHFFLMSRDVTGVTLQGFDRPVSKKGHELAWVSFKEKIINGAKVKIPLQYNTEKIYLTGDFAVLRLSDN